MTKDLTKGNETKAIISFAIPLIVGNIFQQLYNVADSIIVGKYIGSSALAAVGSSFTIIVFLTSIILGLCMGASVVFSQCFGAKDEVNLKSSIFTAFIFIGVITIIINLFSIIFADNILNFMNTPEVLFKDVKQYIIIIFYGIGFTFIYNYFCCLLRSMGNSFIPLVFLIVAAIINIVLDIVFITVFNLGIAGAAYATIIAQGVSGIATAIYCFIKLPTVRFKLSDFKIDIKTLKLVANYSVLASIQQSIMNFGILLIQGLVNSFGVSVMAAFAAAVKIDSFAYMPVQDFGNAFSTYIAQNKGANETLRIKKGIKSSFKIITLFCIAISAIVVLFAKNLMTIFISPSEIEIINYGSQYLYIVSAFYFLIGYLFMFYGFYRGIGASKISILLTIISLGLRVGLAYCLSPIFGVTAIWWAIPIGWLIADIVGISLMRKYTLE
ncbi:MAG: MATE family efflux transporter [Clostridium sp.]